MTTFKVGLKSREFVVSLAKNPFKTIIEMLLKAQKYMNVEDALAAVKDVEKSREKGRRRTIIENKKRERLDRRINDEGKRKDERTP